MSLFNASLHQAEQHCDTLVIHAPAHLGSPCCLACFFGSLQDQDVLQSLKAHGLTKLGDLLADEADGHTVLQYICANHAASVVHNIVNALLSNAQHDLDSLSAGLIDMAMLLTNTESYIGEMLAEVIIGALQSCMPAQLSMGTQQPGLVAVPPAVLMLLAVLLETSEPAASFVLQHTQAQPDIVNALITALPHQNIPMQQLITIIHFLTAFLDQQGSRTRLQPQQLPASMLHDCLFHAASLLASSSSTMSTCQTTATLHSACMQFLMVLARTDAGQNLQPALAQPQAISKLCLDIMTGLKPCLIAAGHQAQPQALQLVFQLCRHTSLVWALIQHDLVEYLCEGLRSIVINSQAAHANGNTTSMTLGSILGKRKLHTAGVPAAGVVRGPGPYAWGSSSFANPTTQSIEELQVSILTCLTQLSQDAAVDVFVPHLLLVLDTLLIAGETAANSHNLPVLVSLLPLLHCAVAPSTETPISKPAQSEIRRCLAVAASVFPEPAVNHQQQQPQQEVVLPDTMASCCSASCQLVVGILHAWSGSGGSVAARNREAKYQPLIMELLVKALQGLSSLTVTSLLKSYLQDVCSVVVAWLSMMPPTQDSHMMCVISAVEQALLPAMTRCTSELESSSERMNQLPAATEALSHAMTAVAAAMLIAVGPSSSETCIDMGSRLVASLLTTGWTSTCMNFMTHGQVSDVSAWQLLLAMQHGAAHLGHHHQPAGTEQLLALCWSDIQTVAGQLAGLTSWTSVLQHYASHGVSMLGDLSVYPLRVLFTAVLAQDMQAIPQHCQQQLVAVMMSCCPASGGKQAVAQGKTQTAQMATQIALEVYLLLDTAQGVPAGHQRQTGAATWQQAGCEQLEQVARVVQRVVEWQPGAMAFGGRIATWLLRHAEQLPVETHAAMVDWLSQTSQVSAATQRDVHLHLATQAVENPALLNIMLNIITNGHPNAEATSFSKPGSASVAGLGFEARHQVAQQSCKVIQEAICLNPSKVLPQLLHCGLFQTLQRQVFELSGTLSRQLAQHHSYMSSNHAGDSCMDDRITDPRRQHTLAAQTLSCLLQLLQAICLYAASVDNQHVVNGSHETMEYQGSMDGYWEVEQRHASTGLVIEQGWQLAAMVTTRLLPAQSAAVSTDQDATQQQLSALYSSISGCELLVCLMDLMRCLLLVSRAGASGLLSGDNFEDALHHLDSPPLRHLANFFMQQLPDILCDPCGDQETTLMDGVLQLEQPLAQATPYEPLLDEHRCKAVTTGLQLHVCMMYCQVLGTAQLPSRHTPGQAVKFNTDDVMAVGTRRARRAAPKAHAPQPRRALQPQRQTDTLSCNLAPETVPCDLQDIISYAWVASPGLPKALLTHLTWLTHCQSEFHIAGSSFVGNTAEVPNDSTATLLPLLLLLQNAAADPDRTNKVAGFMGLLHVSRLCNQQSSTNVKAANASTPCPPTNLFNLSNCTGWAEVLLKHSLQSLCDAATHIGIDTSLLSESQPMKQAFNSISEHVSASQVVDLLSSLLFVSCFLPDWNDTVAATVCTTTVPSDMPSMYERRPAACPTWVADVFSSTLAEHNSMLRRLLLQPPASIAPFVRNLAAKLAAAGLLDADMLLQLQQACQSSFWQGNNNSSWLGSNQYLNNGVQSSIDQNILQGMAIQQHSVIDVDARHPQDIQMLVQDGDSRCGFGAGSLQNTTAPRTPFHMLLQHLWKQLLAGLLNNTRMSTQAGDNDIWAVLPLFLHLCYCGSHSSVPHQEVKSSTGYLSENLAVTPWQLFKVVEQALQCSTPAE